MKVGVVSHEYDTDELAEIAKDTCTQNLRGQLQYPAPDTGDWKIGTQNIPDALYLHRDSEMLLIVANVDREAVHRCGICGFELSVPGEPCPRCAIINEDVAASIATKRVEDSAAEWFRQQSILCETVPLMLQLPVFWAARHCPSTAASEGANQVAEIADFRDLTDRFYELYGKREYRQALYLLKRESPRFPYYVVIATWFQMRMLALTGDTTGALQLLGEALTTGHWYHEDALHNMPDLTTLQGLPAFEKLVARCRDYRLEAVAEAEPSLTILVPENHPRPWPLLLPLQVIDPDFADHWKTATDVGWLVAIPQSSQVGWFSGMSVWDDIERTTAELQQHYSRLNEQYGFDQDRVVIAGFSRHCQAALQVALSSDVNLKGVIAVEAAFPDMNTWPPIIEAMRNPALRCYFIAGSENTEYYEPAEKMVELLRSHGISCTLEGTSNTRHRFPPEFDRSLGRALSFIACAG
jgi:predicted esterase